MYYYIKGELVAASLGMAVVDAGGVGYKMTISENTFRTLPRPGDKHPTVTLYTYLSVREDGIELFGFGNERELSSFKMLISVVKYSITAVATTAIIFESRVAVILAQAIAMVLLGAVFRTQNSSPSIERAQAQSVLKAARRLALIIRLKATTM
jgi:Holliday junction resolvasome RuvABC DNA-binding subunit